MSVFRRDPYKPENAGKVDRDCSSTLSRYLSGKRKIPYDYLCAVCIALRLHPCRQRYLFSLLMYALPCYQDFRKADKNIIMAYLDGCAFNNRYTLTGCNEQLKAIHVKPLTHLTSAKGTVCNGKIYVCPLWR
ncbi:MAG: hypothetical protein ACLR1S_09240 [Ruminococcus bicirculans (ex Wegman et al. 2014)]